MKEREKGGARASVVDCRKRGGHLWDQKRGKESIATYDRSSVRLLLFWCHVFRNNRQWFLINATSTTRGERERFYYGCLRLREMKNEKRERLRGKKRESV